jgi:HPt (histidine-containing phosphotransfer) domain-containing protein
MGNTAIEIDTFQQLSADLGEEFISELVETYCTETPELIASLQKAFNDQDSETFRRIAHSIKSSSASLGAMRLSEQARELEMIGKSGDLAQAAGKLENLEAEYALVQNEFAELVHGA